jgi:hypothetical protein
VKPHTGTVPKAPRWYQWVLLALVTVLPHQARAFGSEGHRLVATIAERQLSDRARLEVTRLLAIEPGATLASISTWADEARTPSTAAWHYVNLPRDAGCHYEAARDCPDGNCVVGAIERQRIVLTSAAPDAERLKALKYIVHFVADVHQPLHAGFADDKGGNKYQVQAFGRGTNLHALWDTGLVQNWPGGPPELLSELSRIRAPSSDATSPAQWAEESCRAVASDGFYPSGHKIGADYAQRVAPVLKERLASAGHRLAALLNSSMGGH